MYRCIAGRLPFCRLIFALNVALTLVGSLRMTGESPGRPASRMSQFSQAHRTMPGNGAAHMALDERASRTLDRSDAMNAAVATPHSWQRPSSESLAQVIEVEFETVQPLPPAPEVLEDAPQPPPPDIEAIAAALAEEMDRN